MKNFLEGCKREESQHTAVDRSDQSSICSDIFCDDDDNIDEVEEQDWDDESSVDMEDSDECEHDVSKELPNRIQQHVSSVQALTNIVREPNDKQFSDIDARLRSWMEKSQQSQLALQNWDRENGLPASHSKTMVNTSRSREQLLKGVVLRKWDGSPLIPQPSQFI